LCTIADVQRCRRADLGRRRRHAAGFGEEEEAHGRIWGGGRLRKVSFATYISAT
jgi:hypothetical protein